MLSNQSVDAVRNIIANHAAAGRTEGLLTGTTPMATDLAYTGDHAAIKITAVTVVVISIMLLLVHRSITTVILVMMMMGVGLSSVRGTVAALAHFGLIGLTSFDQHSVALAIAAVTDYAIFLIGRYHEACNAVAGPRRRPTPPIAVFARDPGLRSDHRRATFCPQLHPVAVLPDHGRALRGRHAGRHRRRTHPGAAVITVASRFGRLLEPKRNMSARLAQDQDRHRALARADLRGVLRCRPDRPARTARLQGQLRGPAVHAQEHPR